jgi:hypothetical protein
MKIERFKRKKRRPDSVSVDFATPPSLEDCRARLEAAAGLSLQLSDDFAKHVLILSDERFVLEYEMRVGFPALYRLRGTLEPAETGTHIHGEMRGPILTRNMLSQWTRVRANYHSPMVRRHVLSNILAVLTGALLLLGLGWVSGWIHDWSYQLMLVVSFFMLTWKTAGSIVRLLFGSEKVYDSYSAQTIVLQFQHLMLFRAGAALGA